MLQLKKRLKISTRRKTQSPTAASSNVIESIVSLLWGNKSVGAHKSGRLATESKVSGLRLSLLASRQRRTTPRMSASFLVYISNFMSFLATLHCHILISPRRHQNLTSIQNWKISLLEIKRNSRFGLRLHLLKYRSDNKPFFSVTSQNSVQQPLLERKTTFLVRETFAWTGFSHSHSHFKDVINWAAQLPIQPPIF